MTKTPDDLWEDLGSLSEDEIFHVLTKLFAVYEARMKRDADDRQALAFFQTLGNVINETRQCNSNRR